MRRLYFAAPVAMIIVLLFSLAITGCNSDDALKNAYKTMSTAQIAYDTGMKIAADAYREGKISEEQKAQIVKYGEVFYNSWMLANGALKSWAENKDSETAKEVAIGAVRTMLEDYDTYKTLVMELIGSARLPEVEQ